MELTGPWPHLLFSACTARLGSALLLQLKGHDEVMEPTRARQTGMTPNRSRHASMNAQISGVAGRALARKTRRRSQDCGHTEPGNK
jgi:hypothetical protein